ncbi:MAG TPA: GGDEF domain-containing protein [Burkholderiaceae bacterium]
MNSNPGFYSGSTETAAQQRLGSLRLRMILAVLGLSLLLVAMIDIFHLMQSEEREALNLGVLIVLSRDLVLGLLLGGMFVMLLDRLLLQPLRALAASTEHFDPTQPPPESMLETDEEQAPELRQIRHSIVRVHSRLWQVVQSEQGKAAVLRSELQQAQAALDAKNRELGSMSRTDDLTGLAIRREFDEALRREFKRAQRQRGLLALAVLDLDHFKKFNARYGQAGGDEALRRVARLLSGHFKRDTDMVARLGGEEFVALLPDLGLAEAQGRLEQLREDLRALQLPHADGVTDEKILTVSIGLAAYSPAHPYLSPQALMQAADEALYIAKHAGRDRLSMGAN